MSKIQAPGGNLAVVSKKPAVTPQKPVISERPKKSMTPSLKISQMLDRSSRGYEFQMNKSKIMAQLTDYVMNDRESMMTLLTGSFKRTQDGMKNKAKMWDMFLRYKEVRDFDLEEMAYYEFRKLFLTTQASQKK